MLEFEEYKQKLNGIRPKLDLLRGALKLDAAEKEIEELEAASAREGFWNDVEKSQKVQKRLKNLQNKRDNYNRLCTGWDDLMTLCEMAIEENDDSLLEELRADYVQCGHHGNDSMSHEFYDLVGASAAFIDAPDWLFDPESRYTAYELREYLKSKGTAVYSFETAPNQLEIR